MNDERSGADGSGAVGRKALRALGGLGGRRSQKSVSSELAEVSRRLDRLEEELAQERRLQRRVAELADAVQQLLIAEGKRGEPGFEDRLAEYEGGLGLAERSGRES